jgi:hypothetical protein
MGSLVVNEDVFKSERDVVKEEYRQSVLSSPYGRLFGLFVPATVYRKAPIAARPSARSRTLTPRPSRTCAASTPPTTARTTPI